MSNNEQTTIASRLKYAMAVRGISQHELAKKTNISDASLSQYTSGIYKPKQERIMIFAQALGISEEWLMGYDVPMDRLDLDEKTIEMIAAYNKLDEAKKETIRNLINQMQ